MFFFSLTVKGTSTNWIVKGALYFHVECHSKLPHHPLKISFEETDFVVIEFSLYIPLVELTFPIIGIDLGISLPVPYFTLIWVIDQAFFGQDGKILASFFLLHAYGLLWMKDFLIWLRRMKKPTWNILQVVSSFSGPNYIFKRIRAWEKKSADKIIMASEVTF